MLLRGTSGDCGSNAVCTAHMGLGLLLARGRALEQGLLVEGTRLSPFLMLVKLTLTHL